LARGEQPRFRVIALAEQNSIHKPFVEAAKVWLEKEATAGNFSIDYIHDTEKIDDAFLHRYQLFLQLDYPPYAWTPIAASAFQKYIEEGKGGWIGFHHATRRIVQLNEEPVPRKKCIVDLFCVVDVVHRKVAGNRFFLKPDFGCIYKRPVNAVLFSEGDDSKFGLLTLSQHRASTDQQQNHESAATANPFMRKTFAA